MQQSFIYNRTRPGSRLQNPSPMLTILTLTPLPFGGYTGKIIVNGTLYAGTFAGEMKVGNTIINFNTIRQ